MPEAPADAEEEEDASCNNSAAPAPMVQPSTPGKAEAEDEEEVYSEYLTCVYAHTRISYAMRPAIKLLFSMAGQQVKALFANGQRTAIGPRGHFLCNPDPSVWEQPL
ncbi:uncharacterized protein LOC117648590 isoform X1 [Thrips palmi]|uniref:Uncharacterized protein LOC117648590 isoform X1 n=1 Tax=Thrips palmi TaxID=161013 RepID=A0A6P8ZR62_THRPL|nr:uncharacterized protein LOC117648590 isoform X1 [Thrips palmi]